MTQLASLAQLSTLVKEAFVVDMKKLANEEKAHDVVLIIGDGEKRKKYYSHKLILASRCAGLKKKLMSDEYRGVPVVEFIVCPSLSRVPAFLFTSHVFILINSHTNCVHVYTC
jgi:hypothetical protein